MTFYSTNLIFCIACLSLSLPNPLVQYTISEDLSLSESELRVLRKMKELFLEEISIQLEENVKNYKDFGNL
ncbi:hypothetical protein J14TS2_20690 [Bacillus sp. J14TS2]|uniref:hypothetical protein n=1 Tax=Bacillus sp. J14TS2 TaxID=2807188 RepID=UPI001B04B19D|nr:hypothetical protein [Bacillus sp. J14TS2]GIN71594.1 hypothetical protein J14TS2_20690 [Bacillus sp. J14TS2]